MAWQGFDAEAMAKRAFRKSGERCPVCGGSEWDTGGVAVFIQHIRDDRLPQGEGFPCVSLLCLNCGFVRLHALDVLKSQTDPSLN